MSLELALPDPAATDALGGAMAAGLQTPSDGWTLLLEGELGAGKSTLARAFLVSLGHAGAVPSPTYTLVEPYTLPLHTIYHIDLYRIADAEELEFLGWSDMEDGLKVIEWPERVPALASSADLSVRLEYRNTGRNARLEGLSSRGAAYLERIAAAVSEQP